MGLGGRGKVLYYRGWQWQEPGRGLDCRVCKEDKKGSAVLKRAAKEDRQPHDPLKDGQSFIEVIAEFTGVHFERLVERVWRKGIGVVFQMKTGLETL